MGEQREEGFQTRKCVGTTGKYREKFSRKNLKKGAGWEEIASLGRVTEDEAK